MAEKKDKAKEERKVRQTYLPSVPQLFKEAWELFKKTFVSYLTLVGFGIAYVLLVILIGVVIALPTFFSAFSSHFQLFNHITLFSVISLILLGLWGIFYLISLFILAIIFPIVSIFILEGKKGKIIEFAKQSKKYFWAYFLTGLLSGLLIFGGLGLFVIPGFLFAFFFAFVGFEVVIEGQSRWNALKRSYFMVKNYFWEIVGRVLLLEAIAIAISTIFSGLAKSGIHLFGMQVIFSFFLSWYAKGYVFLIYQQIRERTTFPAKISIRWIPIISGIGWVVIILLGFAIGNILTHLPPVHPHYLHRIPQGRV